MTKAVAPEAEGASSDLSHVVFQFRGVCAVERRRDPMCMCMSGRVAVCARWMCRHRGGSWKATTMLGRPPPFPSHRKTGIRGGRCLAMGRVLSSRAGRTFRSLAANPTGRCMCGRIR